MDNWDVMEFRFVLRSGLLRKLVIGSSSGQIYFGCEDFVHIWDTVPLLVGSDLPYNSCNFVKATATDYVSSSGIKPSMVCPHYHY